MAKFSVKMPDDFILKISTLGSRTDEVAGKCLEAGAEVAERSVRSHLKGVIGSDIKGKPRSTGELLNSLGVSPVQVDKQGVTNIKVGFARNRADGRSNVMIANILEYGKPGQSPKPFVKPAEKAAKNDIIAAMQAALDKEVGS